MGRSGGKDTSSPIVIDSHALASKTNESSSTGNAGKTAYRILTDAAGDTVWLRKIDFEQERPGWSTYDVVLRWMNLAASTGDVFFRLSRESYAVGDTLPTTATDVNKIVPDGTQNVVQETTLASGITVPTAGEIAALNITRFGTNANDTSTGSVGIIEVRLVGN